MKRLNFRKCCLILVSLVLPGFVGFFDALAQSGAWTKFADMPENRYGHTVDEINGKIYIVGGADNEWGYLPGTALIYDISSRVWSQISLYNAINRNCHNSAVVDGKLYVVGGNDGVRTVATMEMFDPNTDKWTQKMSMPTDRGLAACIAFNDKIIVLGGVRGPLSSLDGAGLNTVEVYDTKNDSWAQLADMPTKRWGHSAAAANGKIYVFGGVSFGGPGVYASVEVYDPHTNTWTTKSAKMPTPRYCLTTCLLDSIIYTIGGWFNSGSGPMYDKVECYNFEKDEWKTEYPLPVALATLAGTVIDGKIYVFGGTRTTHPCYGTSAIYKCEGKVVSVELASCTVRSYLLCQNYPNPFNPSTTIEFSLPRSSYVSLKVFSLLGEEVATLAGQDLTAGSYKVDWNARGVASGVYLYRLVAGSFVETRKLLLLK